MCKPGESIIITIDASTPITQTHMQKIENLAKFMNNKNQQVQFVVYDAAGVRGIDNRVPYSYNAEQLAMLDNINQIMLQNNQPSLRLSAFEPKENWSYEMALKANQFIDEVVQDIRKFGLTPYEAMMYIHGALSSMENKLAAHVAFDDSRPEQYRTLLSYYTENGFVCVAYADWVKAIVDKLQMPNLTCTIETFRNFGKYGYQDGGHALNKICIEDPAYGICGEYLEDAYWSAGNQNVPYNFATFLYPLEDFAHVRWQNQDVQIFHKMQSITHEEITYGTYEEPPSEKFSTFLKYKSSEPISELTFARAFKSLNKKFGALSKSEVNAWMKEIIQNSKFVADGIFDEEANNMFTISTARTNKK